MGSGIGCKVRGGVVTPEQSVKIYVERKVKEVNEIPPSLRIRPDGRPLARSGSPVRPGCAIATEDAPFKRATLGAIVRDRNRPDQWYVLSNNHVLDRNGRVPNGKVFHLRDDGRRIAIAETEGLYVLLRITADNEVDCALAPVRWPRRISPLPLPAGVPLAPGHIEPRENMTVWKVGARTGRTTGTIIDVDVSFGMDMPGIGYVQFKRQVLIDTPDGAFSGDGDSGALVVDEATNQATALVFASSVRHPQRSSAETFTAACRLGTVLETLSAVLSRKLGHDVSLELVVE